MFGTNLNSWDLLVVVFYFGFQLSLGLIFRAFSKDASDYFRAGGSILWWLVGASAFMTQFSAWTFTGAAGKAYLDGSLVAAVFFGNAVGYLGNYFLTAHRFRRLRVITPIEAVRDRYGNKNEQVFTWIQVPMSIVYAGIWLNGLGIVASSFFNIPMSVTIIIVGVVVVFMSVTGGSWAIIASDFMQTVLLMSITIVACFLALSHPAVGGLSGFIEKVPEHHFKVWESEDASFVYLWIFAAFVIQSFKLNNMFESYRYLAVKDDKQAKKAALMAATLMFVGPFIWFIPPMAASIIQPDLSLVFPHLGEKAHEGAFVFIGLELMPAGMLGLLLCALFAATISSMDSGLNRNAGIIVKNFYNPVFRPDASGKELLVAGKIASALFGVLIICSALMISQIQQYDLFEIMVLFGALIAIPYAMPLVWGIFFKGAPRWAAWSSLIVGLTFSYIAKFQFDPSWLGYTDLSGREASDLLYIISGLGNIFVCSVWFFLTIWIGRLTGYKEKPATEKLFENLKKPVNYTGEGGVESDGKQARILGLLCFVYGGFITLLGVAIPNQLSGRLCFAFCGLLIVAIGTLLYQASKKVNPGDRKP
ncbi:transporter [Puniceicoccales bacterium CK1056]|uniref:Transporter n=1 Tax=Oceanipulchritudo coccoides TaxID=2706888 RepID=A0A6B2M5G9_9BACT|nr:transporter [Oceanipulchritudo coccoides]NDV63419.1 transporter [Oceanipulchritudo coccoides]